MKKMNKRAIELSVNFIVILILAIATFSLAVVLTYNMFAKAYTMKKDIDAQTKQQIGSLLDSGEKVAIPINTLLIKAGNGDVFGLGILNTEDEKMNFRVEIAGVSEDGRTDPNEIGAYDANGEELDDAAKESAEGITVSYLETVEELGVNRKQVVLIKVNVDKTVAKGIYSYTVRVYKDDGTEKLYGFPQKISVDVS